MKHTLAVPGTVPSCIYRPCAGKVTHQYVAHHGGLAYMCQRHADQFGYPEHLQSVLVCEFPSCGVKAECAGLLQVENPKPGFPKGIQRNVLVCDYHSFRWSGMWGSWLIENDAQYGVPFGAEGKVIYNAESDLAMGVITPGVFVQVIANVSDSSTGVVSLDKAEPRLFSQLIEPEPEGPTREELAAIEAEEAGFIEVIGGKPQSYVEAKYAERGMKVTFTHQGKDVRGIVDCVDPCPDYRGRIGLYVVTESDKPGVAYETKKFRLFPERVLTYESRLV